MKEIKLEEKQKQKIEKQKTKIKQLKLSNETNQINNNMIISITNIIPLELDSNICHAILKTGKNKGKQCIHKMMDNYLFCKRHMIYQKKEIEDKE